MVIVLSVVFIRWCGKLAARADDRGVIKEVMTETQVGTIDVKTEDKQGS